ncbi:sensor histidine kinase [Microbacterium sp. P07]|uniref:sensor histidine kinase n=1 Tax=Microbacterium sp. P07 TaxID=3366952 RepID=UPI00374583E5
MTTGSARRARRVRRWVRGHRSVVDPVVYALCAVASAALGVSGLWNLFSFVPPDASPWWTLVTALPACAVVLLRDRFPLAALLAATAIGLVDLATVGGLVPLLVVLDTLYVATRDAAARRRRMILFAVAVTVAAIGTAALAAVGEVRVAAVIVLQVGALLGTTYWYATAVAQSRELVALHRQRAEDAEALAARAREAAVQDEREAMARELHDLVAGHVSAMAIRAEASLASPSDGERDRGALRAVRDSGLEAHEALRSMISVLRSPSGSPRTFALPRGRDTVAASVDAARLSGLRVTLHDEIRGPVADPVDQAIARIVQESLANCLRHAAGAVVEVHLSEGDGEVRVRVTSQGGVALRHPPLEGSGWGLELIRERARAVGGELQAGEDGSGWTVQARLPKVAPI